MSNHRLLSLTEAAAELGIRRETLGELVSVRGIQTHKFPYNGKAKGLDASGMATLRSILGQPARRKARVSA